MTEVHVEFDVTEPIDLEDADIRKETDISVLCGWYSALIEAKEELKDTVSFAVEIGTAEEPWLYRCSKKIVYLKKAARLTEQRILSLGGMPPYPLNDGRARQLRNLEQKLNQARDLLQKNGLHLPSFKEQQEAA